MLELHALCRHFGGVRAVDGLDLAVQEGQIFGLIGPNGSGKTTLFSSIVGAHPVDEGHISFDGQDITRLRVDAIARLGLIRTYQQTRVFRGMDCMRNMLVSAPPARDSLGAMFKRFPAELEARAKAAQRASARLAETASARPAPEEVAPTSGRLATAGAGNTRTLVVDAVAYHLPGRTASGLPVGIGVIAVDPAVIPLGTRVFVPGYGSAVAADVGSAIRGAIIDLWMPSTAAARAWGRRTVTITVYG